MRPHWGSGYDAILSWRVDETYGRVKGRRCYLYRAIDSAGQIRWVSGDDVLVKSDSSRRSSIWLLEIAVRAGPSSQFCQAFKVATHPKRVLCRGLGRPENSAKTCKCFSPLKGWYALIDDFRTSLSAIERFVLNPPSFKQPEARGKVSLAHEATA